MIELIIVIVYLLGMIAIGLWSRRKAKRADDFFVAGRKGSTLYVTGSLLATIIGASATIGMAGLGFSRGLTGAWWLLAGTFGLVIMGLLFARKIREYGVYTLPQLAGKMYNRTVAMAISIFIVVAWIGVIAAQIIATGQIMSVLGIGSPGLWIVICTAVFIIYTVLGGQHSVLRTDFVQVVIIFLGIFGGLAFVLAKTGGFAGLVNRLPAADFAFPVSAKFDGFSLASMLLLVGATYVVGPDMYSRVLCAKDGATAKKSVLWAAALLVPFAFGITLIGMGAAAIYPNIAADQSFPTVIKNVYPQWVSGIVIAALLSAVMSSAVTCLLSAGTILNVDIIKRFYPATSEKNMLRYSRVSIVILGAGAMLIALYQAGIIGQVKNQGIISTIMWAYTIFTAGVILPIAFGFFKDRLKLTAGGALAAIIGGGTAGLLSKVFPAVSHLDLWSLAIGGGLLFAGSYAELRIRAAAKQQAADDKY
jgi:solute:Na+ symporter, SSS family